MLPEWLYIPCSRQDPLDKIPDLSMCQIKAQFVLNHNPIDKGCFLGRRESLSMLLRLPRRGAALDAAMKSREGDAIVDSSFSNRKARFDSI